MRAGSWNPTLAHKTRKDGAPGFTQNDKTVRLANGMIPDLKHRRFVVAQLLIGSFLTLLMTYLSLAIADRPTTPQVVRYVFSPGYVLGVRFATGKGFLDTLGSFGRIAIAVNMIYYGSI